MLESYETFSDDKRALLEQFVTSTRSNVFALKGLPEVIKGALFSRYSRSKLPLRSLLLKDFIANDEALFSEISGSGTQSELLAIKKAQDFYDRILDGYGDDSIGELGGAHLAMENISMLATKVIEDCRIGGSPLEKSTRYIYFNDKRDGKYLYYRDPKIMASKFGSDYERICDMLFDTYSELSVKLTEMIKKVFVQSESVSDFVYNSALRAKVLDCLRGLLPAATLTNMGQFGNGRFYETLVQKLHLEPLHELKDLGEKSYNELSKVIPSFVRRSQKEHRHFLSAKKFKQDLKEALSSFKFKIPEAQKGASVKLVHTSQDCVDRVLEALLYSDSNASLNEIAEHVKRMTASEKKEVFKKMAACRQNRRHKLPRALEHANFTFDITADYGIYRDLHRHRMLTQDRQDLSCNHGYWIPDEIQNTELMQPYCKALDEAKTLFDQMALEMPQEAQYAVPLAYNIRWYFHVNLRNLQWLCELRSSEQGHVMYRRVAQSMADQIIKAEPAFEDMFNFVDFNGYELGRLNAELRQEKKLQSLKGV
jgi:thymidylate synthase ThyX